MSTKHTPGPWSADRHGNIHAPDSHTILAAVLFRGDHSEADSRLMAAAPELAEALDDMLSMLRGELPDAFYASADRISLARAALTKARGQ